MFNVQFFDDFLKRENSTKQPLSTAGAVIACNLKDQTSAINPVLQIRGLAATGRSNPVNYNYCYIATFDRYYFIDDWTYNEGIWECSCRCDVLASFKFYIGNETLYVLRSSYTGTGSIIDRSIRDDFYPTKGGTTLYESVASQTVFEGDYYVIGCMGGDGIGVSTGPITWYTLSPANMKGFCKYMCSDTFYNDVGATVEKELFNPIQYLTAAYWFPFTPSSVGSGRPVYMGWFPMSNVDYFTASRLDTPTLGPFTYTINVPRHPQAATRGSYLNGPGFATYTIYAGPFGVFNLDPIDMVNSPTIQFKIVEIDFTTGYCRLVVNNSSGKTLIDVNTMVAVPTSVAQISQNMLGSTLNAAAGAVSGAIGIGGGLIRDIGYMAASIAGVSLSPKSDMIGSNGNRSNIYQPYLSAAFINVVDDNDDHVGVPACADAQISTIPGYIQCMDGDIEIPGTQAERQSVKAYLEGGFFYE